LKDFCVPTHNRSVISESYLSQKNLELELNESLSHLPVGTGVSAAAVNKAVSALALHKLHKNKKRTRETSHRSVTANESNMSFLENDKKNQGSRKQRENKVRNRSPTMSQSLATSSVKGIKFLKGSRLTT
jgi:hypothetical protein